MENIKKKRVEKKYFFAFYSKQKKNTKKSIHTRTFQFAILIPTRVGRAKIPQLLDDLAGVIGILVLIFEFNVDEVVEVVVEGLVGERVAVFPILVVVAVTRFEPLVAFVLVVRVDEFAAVWRAEDVFH